MPPRSAYRSAPTGVARNNARARGWGSGWPDCQRSRIVKVVRAGVTIYLRREIAPLVAVLLEATERVYRYDVKPGQTGGFACRPIRGTSTPSNHSWGLAVDLNWHANPFRSPFRSDLPPAVVAMWWACGFYWGGWYRTTPDPMHFEYVGRPADVAAHLRRARGYLAPGAGRPPSPADWTEKLVKHLPTLKRGAGVRTPSEDVRTLQYLLLARGRKLSGHGPDGRFGAETERELLAVTGSRVCGREQWAKLLRL
jgi:hypothetical protein